MGERLIHILPEQVASQIAAGEVVERPASAVKELLENSLDAGAHSIALEIERGGLSRIAVVDDGCGMSREDALLSLRRHATSKIRYASDLARIRTLGFRGEALASIASVSRIKLRTRRAEDPHGIELAVSGGNVEEERACGIAPGTQVEVNDLFFNTPARLKFMKTPASEQGAIAEIVQRIALANCAVAFALRADGRELLTFTRAASALERVRQAFGPKIASRMLKFSLARAGLGVSGLATMSQESFASARMIYTFVNGRAVRDKLLARAIAQAYQTLVPRGRYPAVALFVELRHEDVDVNVHPMKTEVRFKNPQAVFEIVYYALRGRLADQTAADAAESPRPSESPAPDISAWARPTVESAIPTAPEPGEGPPRHSFSSAAPALADDRPLRLVADAPAVRPEQAALGLGYQGQAGQPQRDAAAPVYSRLRVLGQLFAGYIALESEDGLVLVDQHAAHERVTFEKLRAELRSGAIRVQALLAPITVELHPARAAQVEAALPKLRAMGFDLEPFGPAALLLKGTPAVFGALSGASLLSDMIESMGEIGSRADDEAGFENLLKQLACHGSVRVGRALEAREIEELLAELDGVEFKTNCPHGRPVHISFGRGQIERMFRR